MILVVGGTGRLGGHVVRGLAAAGVPVRVLTRDRRRAAGLPGDVAVGDLLDAESLARALAGCRVVLAAAHGLMSGRGGPQAVDRDGNGQLVDAAIRAGVEHVVLMSVQGAAPDHPMSLHRMKYAAEQGLTASGLTHTIVRAPAYYETWIDILGAKVGRGGPAVVFGRGRNPINFVSVRDVADIVLALIGDAARQSARVDVLGPEDLTMTAFAERLARHAGSSRVRHIPRPVLRAMAVAALPVAPTFARMARGAVAMDTATMTAPAPAGVARRETGRRTLDDVLAGS